MIYATSGGAVTLYHNNSAKLATTSTGVNVTGHITASGTNNIYVVHKAASLSVTPPSGRNDDIANLQVTSSLSGEDISGTLNRPIGLNATDGSACLLYTSPSPRD